ncbi:unnamed protein product [Tetraodon nigroviridis]|uniref:(spotted green pufferfish) hypothetical protein n=1 Tax=Tetraodon nigroviridis TaxID=99883 RepID=Q4RID5_TETNG|nr:unnamed protein product [Tetraodon nigroviridis]
MGGVLSRESPWLCEKGNNSLSPAAPAVPTPPPLSAERYKHTALTSLGLGSSHLSSFGGGWSGLGQNWTKFGGLGAAGFGSTNPSWRSFSGERNAGLHSAWRGWDQHRSTAPDNSEEEVNKRRPGRPRKRPLPSAFSTPQHSSAVPPVSPDLFPCHSHGADGREGGARQEDRGPERSREELESRARKRKKRKHGDSPYHQSADEDTPPECYSPSEDDEAPSQQAAFQEEEEKADGPPRKTYLVAGLYSDDYKTADPPSQSQEMCGESVEYTPGEHDYSLLPAPIHVGKYLRLKRIHFQLPYDVMWQWQHDQKENSGDISSLFPHLNMELLSSERYAGNVPIPRCHRRCLTRLCVYVCAGQELCRETPRVPPEELGACQRQTDPPQDREREGHGGRGRGLAASVQRWIQWGRQPHQVRSMKQVCVLVLFL